MKLGTAIVLVAVAVGLVVLDLQLNTGAATAATMRGLIGIVEWLAFWR